MSISDKLTQIAENEQKVYDSGYVSGKNKMWDNITANGVKEHYIRTFYAADFTGETFPSGVNPIRSCAYMFYDYRGTELPKNIDLSQLSQSVIDFNGNDANNGFGNIFGWATQLTKIYDMKLPAPKVYEYTFQYLGMCETIEMPIKSTIDTRYRNTFLESKGIVNMRIEGTIGQNGFNVSWSKQLSHDSLMSIINALADYSADTSGTTWTVTLGSENIAKLTEEEKMIAFMKGWDLA